MLDISFTGRVTRSTWWLNGILGTLVLSIAVFVAVILIAQIPNIGLPIAVVLYLGSSIYLNLRMIGYSIRRLHDMGYSAWYYLISLVPLLNIVFFLFLGFLNSRPDNKYGPNPKGQ